ncbi:hypothetical protein RWE15_13380 [Virgibacillus halophilus]|uniref:Cytochrome C and Quinol oxidase polypeptide I n=1 Tax=Tigheibacillus halophilus TaxID=361280 RepID=A0ABU5C9L2_9BACI|nr:hypothetical protein [Virgibacillus halophilus]
MVHIWLVQGGYQFRSVHAHILVVGWLTLFAWSVYYKLYKPAYHWLAGLHVWTAIIGAVGLTAGMYFYYVKPFGVSGTFPTVFFIVGGTIMLISFVCFALITFLKQEAND